MQNYNNYNPYNNFGYGYNNQMQDPNQLRQQVEQSLNQYQNLYNRNQNLQNINNKRFNGVYVDSEQEVLKAQVPADGTPMLFVGNGVMWSKKFVNGQPYISTFSFSPINNVGEPNNINIQNENKNAVESEKTQLNQVLEKLNELNNRINNMEERVNEYNSNIKIDKKSTTSNTNVAKSNEQKQSTNGKLSQ